IPLEIYFNDTLISILFFFKQVFDFHCFHSIQALRNTQKVGKKYKKKKKSIAVALKLQNQVNQKAKGKKSIINIKKAQHFLILFPAFSHKPDRQNTAYLLRYEH
ncbi:hypothetical protein PanWU01x14_131930, partial [Parasponia andersonii]